MLDYGTAKAGDYRRLQGGSIANLGTKYGGAFDALAGADRSRLTTARVNTDDALNTVRNQFATSLSDQSTYAPALRRSRDARLRSEAMQSKIRADAVAGGGSIDDSWTRGQLGAAQGAYNAEAADAFADAEEGREDKRLAIGQAIYRMLMEREAGLRSDYMGALGGGANIASQQIAGWGNLATAKQAEEEAERQRRAAFKNAIIGKIADIGGLFGIGGATGGGSGGGIIGVTTGTENYGITP